MRSYFMLAALLAVCGCGSDDNWLDGSYEVREVRVEGEEVRAAESIRTNVYFDTKTDYSGEPQSVELVIEVSSDLEYVEGSSYIYVRSTDDEAHRAPDDVVRCGDGRTFVIYYLDRFDLEDRELVSKGQWALRIYVRGMRIGALGVVRASADDVQHYSCFEPFDAQEADTVRVLP